MVYVKIPRPQKDQMRQNLEVIIQMHKEIDQKIDVFKQETEVGEYQNYWSSLKSKTNENIQNISAYMVRKCNR